MCLTLSSLSFDDNKGIKISQLDMFIFLQVCRTIVKNSKVKYWFWKNKWDQRNLQRKLMLQESEDHQKLTARRVWRPLRSWCHQRVWRSSEAEVQRSLKTESWSLLKVVILKTYHCRRNGSLEQRLF